ncbi:MAG: hypothetical protein L3V56_10765 [Candidatus Magnetoovum sp. WYHC-5]|nr:hypothetical protein [Candidatus Magnetoovum sp. WYHC-5]
MSIYDGATNEWITENPWNVERHITEDETLTLSYQLRLPYTLGTYNLTTEVGYTENSQYTKYWELASAYTIEKGSIEMTNEVVTALEGLSVTGNDKAKVSNALKYLYDVQGRVSDTAENKDANISDILKAIEAINGITADGIGAIVEKLSKVLMIEQGRFYSLSQNNS